jgi:pseudaminic acid biosynthesis-associated methylase
MMTKQVELWRSEFGDEYAQRGNSRITPEGQRRLVRDWGTMLTHAVTPAPQSVLEVGCNVGRNLLALSHFVPEVHGIEPNPRTCEFARSQPGLAQAKITEGDGFKLDYDDASIDLVFTSGVLIHIAPDDLGQVVDEIVRVSRHYVLCNEYFSNEPEEIPYRGLDGYLFKRDFGRFYLDRHPNLRVVDYGFLWKILGPGDIPISGDNSNWWLFAKD